MGVMHALVVHGQDGLDEVSASAPTTVCELKDGYYRTSVITPEELGLVRGKKEELVGGTPQENAEITRGILNGSIQGTKRNSVLLNAGLSLYIAGAAGTMADGVRKAEQLIDSGDAYRKMESYIRGKGRTDGKYTAAACRLCKIPDRRGEKKHFAGGSAPAGRGDGSQHRLSF